ncbi:cytochrome c oxidase assembly protein COX16 homolog, mitochondrial [Stomoxys calcitrans]|uniref:Cytochrome c oxidase assembly protein COX16 homolog, mitochondrial n=1 Tax=Stomoxys calcitrans TaxID=35570 RepID=A0A1I8PVB6_STOCA|nr:cytochrome c oxidase assembly protein COX16 homolog, mitochondrial [Stomoxys calcitrans]
MALLQKLSSLKRNKSFKYGVPFLVLMVGGSFGLQEFTKLRYQFSKQKTITPDEMEHHGVKMKKPDEVTIEKVYEKVKALNIDNWENKRGPRPWEET